MEFSKCGERFTATDVPFGALVLTAYNITLRQLSGPAEFLSEKYDVAAKADRPVRPPEMLRMLQTLLAERFKLVVRREIKEVPAYALTTARGGPKLREPEPVDDGREGLRNPFLAAGTEQRGGYVFRRESMSDFAWALTRMAGIGDRVVIDHTGLTGRYDFELSFERDPEPTLREGPSIFSALQEQLGLKLEARREPVDFVIVEHVERPVEN
jgi:uncharacterized protein (TIGR03435 family)